jgi:hypothetical protein
MQERAKEDSAKITDFVLEQTGDGKEAPIKVKSCCCRPCGADLEKKHQWKEMRWREMYYDHEAERVLNPIQSSHCLPEVETINTPKHKTHKRKLSASKTDRITLVDRFH